MACNRTVLYGGKIKAIVFVIWLQVKHDVKFIFDVSEHRSAFCYHCHLLVNYAVAGTSAPSFVSKSTRVNFCLLALAHSCQ